MNKIATILMIFFVFAFSNVVAIEDSGSSTSTTSSVEHENCGLDDDGLIDPFDHSICKDDIAFSVIFDNFRYVYEDYIFQIFDFDYLEDLSSLEEGVSSKLRVSNLMSEIFITLVDISIVFIMGIIIYNIIIGIFSTLSDGEFMGRQFNTKKNLYYYLAGIFLLIPIGDFFVIHIIIFILITIAILPANFIYTYFLYSIMISMSPVSTDTAEIDDSQYNHNYFYAARQADFLTNMHLCKKMTSSYYFSDYRDRYTDLFLQDYNQCNTPQNSSFYYDNVSGSRDDVDFLNYTYAERDQFYGDTGYGFYDSVEFGKFYHPESCDNNDYGENLSSFNCGQIKMAEINLQFMPDIKIMQDEFIQSIRSTISSMVGDNYNYDTVKNNLESFLSSYRERMIEIDENGLAYTSEVRDIAGDYVSGITKDKVDVRIVFYYHQALLNHLNIGTTIYEPVYSGTSDEGNRIIYQNTSFFDNAFSDLNRVSEDILNITCAPAIRDIKSTLDMVDAEDVDSNEKSSICLNLSDGSVYGEDMGYQDVDDMEPEEVGALSGEIRNNIESLIDDSKNRYVAVIERIKNNRDTIERSLVQSIINLNLKDTNEELNRLIKARQQGFMSFPSIMMMMDDYYSMQEKVRRDFAFSYKTIRNYGDGNLISMDQDPASTATDEEDKDGYKNNFESHKVNNDFLTDYKNQFYDPKYVNAEDDRTMESIARDGNMLDFIGNMVDNLNPIKTLAGALNVQRDGVFLDDEINYGEVCSDPSKFHLCPMPKTNPLVSFNEVGLTFFFQGVKLTTVSFLPSITTWALNRKGAKFTRSNEGTNIGKGKNLSKKTGSGFSKVMDQFAEILKLFSNLLLTIGVVLMFLGLVLAFMIPLVPFIFLLINFIEWIILSFNLMITAPIFVSNLFNISQTEKEVSKFIKNSILSLVLRPMIIIISMIFLWSFYYIVIFFINLTIFDMMSEAFISDNLWVQLSAPIMFIVVFVLVIFIITRYVFVTIADIHEKIFDMIDVSSGGSSRDGSVDNILTFVAGKQIFQSAYGSLKEQKSKIDKLSDEKKEKIKEDKQFFDNISEGKDKDLEYNGKRVNAANKTVTDAMGNEKTYRDEVDMMKAINDDKNVMDLDTLDNKTKRLDLVNSYVKGGYDEDLDVDWDKMTYKGKEFGERRDLFNAVARDSLKELSITGMNYDNMEDIIREDKRDIVKAEHGYDTNKFKETVALIEMNKFLDKNSEMINVSKEVFQYKKSEDLMALAKTNKEDVDNFNKKTSISYEMKDDKIKVDGKVKGYEGDVLVRMIMENGETVEETVTVDNSGGFSLESDMLEKYGGIKSLNAYEVTKEGVVKDNKHHLILREEEYIKQFEKIKSENEDIFKNLTYREKEGKKYVTKKVEDLNDFVKYVEKQNREINRIAKANNLDANEHIVKNQEISKVIGNNERYEELKEIIDLKNNNTYRGIDFNNNTFNGVLYNSREEMIEALREEDSELIENLSFNKNGNISIAKMVSKMKKIK